MDQVVFPLPDVVLLEIFKHLTVFERIAVITLVCKKWHRLIHSANLWNIVDFNGKRSVTLKPLEDFVFPGTRSVLLNECLLLKWDDIKIVLKRCRHLQELTLSYISLNGTCTICFTDLNIRFLHYLDVSNCILAESLYELVASTCEVLNIFLLQCSTGISENTFKCSQFKQHRNIKVVDVAYIREALSFSCILEMLKYNNNTVLLDIRGHQLMDHEIEFIATASATLNGQARIVEVEDYCHLLY